MAMNWVGRNPLYLDIPEPSHGRVFREKFHSVYVVKGIWSFARIYVI